ncbi:hypothetical protein [Mycolicibacillus trivialis]
MSWRDERPGNWIHEMERTEEGFARYEAQRRGPVACAPGGHSWVTTRYGGACTRCGETIGADEL